jgi:hypothetical protein
MTCVPAEIRIEHHPNTSPQRYIQASLLVPGDAIARNTFVTKRKINMRISRHFNNKVLPYVLGDWVSILGVGRDISFATRS